MKKKNKLPISIVIPTLGQNHLIECLRKINHNSFLPSEVLIVVPKKNFFKILQLKSIFPKLNLITIFSLKKNQVHQRILGFKKARNNYVLQLDDDYELDKNCLINLYSFIKGRKDIAVAPRFIDEKNVSSIYKRPKSFIFKFYHWLLNSSEGYSPGNISLSGFNYYSLEKKMSGFANHQWLSGGAVIHHKKNLVLKNYYPYNFNKCFCEDVLHSLILREKKIKLIKFFGAQALERQPGKIADNSSKTGIFKDLYSEFLIRRYIVKKYKFSYFRLIIYYLIYLIRILRKISK